MVDSLGRPLRYTSLFCLFFARVAPNSCVMIELLSLSKKYGDFTAVDSLEFRVERGEIFGFLGPNGAGKTTTLRMLMGILVPTSGHAKINGYDCQKDSARVKRIIGYLPDQPSFYDYLRGREILSFVCEMHGFSRQEAVARSSEWIKKFGLKEHADDFAINYSLGMKKRLGLAMAMVHEPKVLILDEPLNGLDPRGAHEIQNELRVFAKSGGTVLLSTHLLDVAQKICSRVAIIDHGKLKAVDSISNLIKFAGSPRSREAASSSLKSDNAGDSSNQNVDAPSETLESLFLRMTES